MSMDRGSSIDPLLLMLLEQDHHPSTHYCYCCWRTRARDRSSVLASAGARETYVDPLLLTLLEQENHPSIHYCYCCWRDGTITDRFTGTTPYHEDRGPSVDPPWLSPPKARKESEERGAQGPSNKGRENVRRNRPVIDQFPFSPSDEDREPSIDPPWSSPPKAKNDEERAPEVDKKGGEERPPGARNKEREERAPGAKKKEGDERSPGAKPKERDGRQGRKKKRYKRREARGEAAEKGIESRNKRRHKSSNTGASRKGNITMDRENYY